MSVNIFKNGILSKIAGAVGDAVPLINNFLTNQAGKGAADANTVYVLNNKIDEVNSSLNSKVSNFTSGNYKAVTGLAYDATNKKLGLKVGADSVVPFSNNKVTDITLYVMQSSRTSMCSIPTVGHDIYFNVEDSGKVKITFYKEDGTSKNLGVISSSQILNCKDYAYVRFEDYWNTFSYYYLLE